MTNAIVSVEHLSVTFDHHVVLNNLSFEIARSAIVAVVGPNGSGKTTLIRAILGLVSYQGRVLVNGHPISGELGRIGYVPQSYTFDRTIPMTVTEFLKIAFPNIKSRKIKHVLEEVDMAKQAHSELGTLSGGQLQRVLIARSLMNDPALLLLDEATSGVDVAGAKSFYDIVAHLNQIHHTTVLLISHEINMVYRFANQIICLNRDLICYGKPGDVMTKEVLEKLYGKDVRFQEHKH